MIKMDAEIGSYQEDFDPGSELLEPSRSAAENAMPILSEA
jgi:hypothetical protein